MLLRLANGNHLDPRSVRGVFVDEGGEGIRVRVLLSDDTSDSIRCRDHEDAASTRDRIALAVNQAAASAPAGYHIVTGTNPEGVSRNVQGYLREGWELLGLTHVVDGRFHQALVLNRTSLVAEGGS